MEIWRKDLIQVITKKCKERNIDISSDLVAFLLSLLLLNPEYYDEDGKIDKMSVIETIVNILLGLSKPRLMTFKLQLYFIKHYEKRDEKIKNYRQRLREKTNPLIKEICETKKPENDKDIQRLYQKILVVITLLNGLGKPTVPVVLREAELALQSVYPHSELPCFMYLTRREKEEQLVELACIVAGIRLFNKDCQRGGEGIDDLPSILQRAVDRAETFILELLEELMEKIYKFTAVVEKLLPRFFQDKSEIKEFGYITEDHVPWIIEMLTAYRQQEVYVRKILADVETCKIEVKYLLNCFQNQLMKLHDTVRYKTAIPTSLVYPQFVNLADTWLKLQDEVLVLSQINTFLLHLRSLCVVEDQDDPVFQDIMCNVDGLTDAKRLEMSMDKLITNCGECVVHPSTVKDFDKIDLEFLGFCAWTFIIGEGALIPGNPNIGVVEWKGKYFAFSSAKAAEKFGQDSSRYLRVALDFIQKRPEYIYLFQMYDEMERMKRIGSNNLEIAVQQDQGMQTEIHILPAYIDKDYYPSIWEYKKKALHLANISQCNTKSTQTAESQFRCGARIQAAPAKDKEVQTNKDSSTNTKKQLTYISGLRGNFEHIFKISNN